MSNAATRTPAGRKAPRGREARSPGQIPKKGWLDILYRTFTEIGNDRLTLVAAGITFYLLLALAPTLAAFVSIYGLFFDPATIQDHAAALTGILPGGGMQILTDQLERLASADQATLGLAFAVSLGLALWSANAGMKALFQGMNVAYDEVEKRGFVKLTAVTMTITVLTLAAVIGLIAFNLLFTTFTEVTGLNLPNWVANLITAGIALTALIVFMGVLYRFGPSRADARLAWITPGAVVAGLLIVIVSAAFTFYVSNFGTYNETYGSLGAVVGFLTWLWLTMIVLLLGGELNSEMEHQTRRDTTTGAPREMGKRNAVMADNVGPTWREKRAGDEDAHPANFQADRKTSDGADARRDGRGSAPGRDIGRGATRRRRPSTLGVAVLVGGVALALANRAR